MRIVLDTNVFVSGAFWNGPPAKILRAWQDGAVTLILSPDILEEYQRVVNILAHKMPKAPTSEILQHVVEQAEMHEAPALETPLCRDPDGDKFIACAISAEAGYIVTGDDDLLELVGTLADVEIWRPGPFAREVLNVT